MSVKRHGLVVLCVNEEGEGRWSRAQRAPGGVRYQCRSETAALESPIDS